jgi:outer membrane protein OmpA-like peptidoglycan-associated protein
MSLIAVTVAAGALVSTGCATKKYVQQQTSPIQAKVDQVGDQTNKNTASIDETNKSVKDVDERATAGISGARERAVSAENRANEAMSRADQANSAVANVSSMASKTNSELAALRSTVATIDDYKLHGETTVLFKFGQDKLTEEAQQALDELVTNTSSLKRFVISVKGFTDSVGSADYNAQLSRRRADNVVKYLVGKHNLPLYRVHMIGLGKDMPADEGKTREARAKNRRVEVKIFTADLGSSQLSASSTSGN